MKYLKKKVLFSLASETDFFQAGPRFSYHPYQYIYFRTSEFDRGSIRSAVNQLASAGLIDKIARNRRVGLRLTGLGHEILLKNFSRIAWRQPWGGHWLIVAVSHLGSDSRPLQTQLYRLGFRRFSRGLYLCPWALAEEARAVMVKNNWVNRVFIIESRRLLSADDWQLARNLWQLEKLAGKYDRFINLSSRLLKISRTNLVLLQQAKFGFKAVFDAYFQLISLDPGLPKALLPPDWQAEEAKSLFSRLVELAKTAKI